MKRSKVEEELRKQGMSLRLSRRSPSPAGKYNSFTTVHVSSFVKGGLFAYDLLVEAAKKSSPVDK